jgi:hypothetical protein
MGSTLTRDWKPNIVIASHPQILKEIPALKDDLSGALAYICRKLNHPVLIARPLSGRYKLIDAHLSLLLPRTDQTLLKCQ